MLVGYSQAEQAARRAECWKYLRLGTEPGPIPAVGTQSLAGPPLAGKSQVDITEFSDSLGHVDTPDPKCHSLFSLTNQLSLTKTKPCTLTLLGFQF